MTTIVDKYRKLGIERNRILKSRTSGRSSDRLATIEDSMFEIFGKASPKNKRSIKKIDADERFFCVTS